jgi:ABC-type transport system substrate-binding protein
MRRGLLLALGSTLLWTALLAGSAGGSPQRALKKGGTLRVDLPKDFDLVDPALASLPDSQAVEHQTCRTLYDASGSLLVPDAAASAPSVSKNGLTWTFNLRADLKYSTGALITARDFVSVIARDADPRMSSPARVYTADIASAKPAGKYRFNVRLKRQAPDLAARLSTTYFCPLPRGTPHNPNGIPAPVPGSGPYYIASWQRNRSAVLKRNPYYRGTRPANPDEIDLTLDVSLENQQLQCETDGADVCSFPPNQAAQLRAKYGVNKGRFWATPRVSLWYLAINHNGDLFSGNDPLARAVNYGVDRFAILRQSGAYAGTPTDQVLPSGFPGFRNWRLYPLKADYAKARRLARGHLRGGNCQLWAPNTGSVPVIAGVLKDNLDQDGIHCAVTLMDATDLSMKAGTRGAGYDLLLNSWTAPYRDPFAYLNVLLDGGQIQARNNVDLSYFDDPAWNRRLTAAAGLRGRARLSAYSKLDRDLMRGPAPLVPLMTTTQTATLVSSRVGCFGSQRVYGTNWGALCLAQSSATLSVAFGGGGQGTVKSLDRAGIDCPATCSHAFGYGDVVTLKAAAGPGSTFTGWTGACSGGSSLCTVTLNGARSVGATFVKKRYTLAVSKAGPGSGTVASDKPGIACGSTCSALYDFGTVVKLTATPDADSQFDAWQGPCSSTAANTCTVTMDQAKVVTAVFGKKRYTLTVSKDGSGTGTVTSDPAGIDCGPTCAHAFDINTMVTLAATADPGSTFSAWSGDCAGAGSCVVPMDTARSITATFTLGSAPDLALLFVELFAS